VQGDTSFDFDGAGISIDLTREFHPCADSLARDVGDSRPGIYPNIDVEWPEKEDETFPCEGITQLIDPQGFVEGGVGDTGIFIPRPQDEQEQGEGSETHWEGFGTITGAGAANQTGGTQTYSVDLIIYKSGNQTITEPVTVVQKQVKNASFPIGTVVQVTRTTTEEVTLTFSYRPGETEIVWKEKVFEETIWTSYRKMVPCKIEKWERYLRHTHVKKIDHIEMQAPVWN
jgi:hypothetical protein